MTRTAIRRTLPIFMVALIAGVVALATSANAITRASESDDEPYCAGILADRASDTSESPVVATACAATAESALSSAQAAAGATAGKLASLVPMITVFDRPKYSVVNGGKSWTWYGQHSCDLRGAYIADIGHVMGAFWHDRMYVFSLSPRRVLIDRDRSM